MPCLEPQRGQKLPSALSTGGEGSRDPLWRHIAQSATMEKEIAQVQERVWIYLKAGGHSPILKKTCLCPPSTEAVWL